MIKMFLLTLTSRGVAVSGSLLLSIYISNVYGAKGLGLFSLSLLILNGMAIVSRYGMDTYYIKFGANVTDRKMNKALFFYLVRKVSVNAFLISILSFMVIKFGPNFKGEMNDFHFILFILPFFSICYMCSSFYKSASLSSISCFFEIGIISFFTCLGLFLTKVITNSILSFNSVYIYMFISSLLISLFGLFFIKIFDGVKVRSRIKLTNHDRLQQRDFFFISIVGYIQLSIFSYICTYFLSLSELGAFKAVERIAMTISFILIVLNSIMMPKFSRSYRTGNLKLLQKLMRKGVIVSFLFTLPIILIIAFFPQEVLSLFGDDFTSYTYLLWLMCFAQWINVLFGSVGTVLNMTDFSKDVKFVTITIAIFSCILLPLFIEVYGLLGLGLFYFISILIQNLVLTFFVYKRLGVSLIPLKGNLYD